MNLLGTDKVLIFLCQRLVVIQLYPSYHKVEENI